MTDRNLYFFATRERFHDKELRKYVPPDYLCFGPGASLAGRRIQRAHVEVPAFKTVEQFVKFSNWLQLDLKCRFLPGYEDEISFDYSWMWEGQ